MLLLYQCWSYSNAELVLYLCLCVKSMSCGVAAATQACVLCVGCLSFLSAQVSFFGLSCQQLLSDVTDDTH